MNDSQSLQPKAKKKIRKFKKKKQLARPQEIPVRVIAKKQEITSKKQLVQTASTSTAQSITVSRTTFFTVTLFLIPVLLLSILLGLIFFNQQTEQELQEQKIRTEESFVKVYPYPPIDSVFSPTLSAKSAIVTDVDSQVVLFSKNPALRFSMASTTKIMTALVALEYFSEDSILTIQAPSVDGSNLSLFPGEQFYFKDLLYAMLLPSANDAAVAIADNYPGGMDVFVQKMNEKAVALHLTDTHFSDPTGLDDDGDYTTVVDLSRLAAYAIQNEIFSEITSTREKTIASRDGTHVYPLVNLNKLLGIQGVTGIKTGTTEGAGEVLVTSTFIDNHTYIIVVMNSTQRFIDTQTLLSFIEQQVKYIDVVN